MAGFTGLQTLDLSDNPGIEHGLESLPRQIRTLHLAGTSLTDDGLRGLSQMTDLHSLVLSSTRISGAGLDVLADLPLQWIGLNRVSFSKDGFDALCRIKKLRKIDISHSSVPDDAWHSLLNCPALRDLNAGTHTAAIQVLLSSSVGSRLESVTLSVADEETLRSLHRFPQLKKLILDSCEIDEDTALILAGSTNCDSLQLKTCSVSVETIHVLEESGFVNDTGLHYLQTEDFREQVFSSMRTPTPRTLHFVRMQR